MSDWSLVGGDPAPGSPATIRIHGQTLQKVASSLDDAASEFDRIARGTGDADWRGLAADAMREVLNSYRDDLRPVGASFQRVSTALVSYANQLEALRNEAARALERAKVANADIKQHSSGLSGAQNLLRDQRAQLRNRVAAERSHAVGSVASTVLDPAASMENARRATELARQSANASSQVTASESRVASLRRMLDGAESRLRSEQAGVDRIREEWDEISKRAAARIDGALANELKNKSNLKKLFAEVGEGWNGLADALWNGELLEWVRDALGKVALYVTIALVVVTILFVLGVAPWLGPALILLTQMAFAIAAAKFATTAAIMIRSSTGGRPSKLTFADLAIDGVSMVMAGKNVGTAKTFVNKVNLQRILFENGRSPSIPIRNPKELKNYEQVWHFYSERHLYKYNAVPHLFKPLGSVLREYSEPLHRPIATFVVETAAGRRIEWLPTAQVLVVDLLTLVNDRPDSFPVLEAR